MRKENVWESLQQFGNERNCDFLVLMGMKEVETGRIRRDIGLVPLRDSKLVKRLLVDNGEYLDLLEKTHNLHDSTKIQLFEQKNVKASRKQILPIIQKAMNIEDSEEL